MALYRNPRRLPPYATCDICNEYRRAAVNRDKKTGGFICLCCAAMRKKPKLETIPVCPKCGRENAPFENDHPIGRKAQTVLGIGNLTQKLCLNCHTVKSRREDGLMKIQAELLPDWESRDKSVVDMIGAGLAAAPVIMSLFSTGDPVRDEELREMSYAFARKLKNDK